MAWLSAISTALSLTTYPITYLAYFGYGVLRLLVNLLIGLARYPLGLALLPFRILAQFEAILIWITTAGCIGLVLGILLYATTHYTVELFNQWVGLVVPHSPMRLEYDALNPESGTVVKRSDTSDIVNDFRLKWGAEKNPGLRGRGASGPSASTILEVDDESSSAYFEE
ncbi:hypothetical protein P170DRAFT_510004 [Aspergillus steynii IBT 23096]|uniref:Uncharacterized protein n=1 Tax=Aspergillus steynii IBT 23096 TaxID=1392250 RepID=A0A2I2G9A9_9EURO|nr:uncharacterized protein P170DRAFT_510004 [Aspergillus steynii IBT 23096]PLB49460.1 hypothetical protein P170DRAFT_510004 [Aspergillus steynii IBT 23096]